MRGILISIPPLVGQGRGEEASFTKISKLFSRPDSLLWLVCRGRPAHNGKPYPSQTIFFPGVSDLLRAQLKVLMIFQWNLAFSSLSCILE